MNFPQNDFKETSIGNLPTEWDVKPIKQIAQKLKAGGTPKRGKQEYYGGDIPFVKIGDITNASTYLTSTEEFMTNSGLDASSSWIVPKNTVLLAMYGSIGKVTITDAPVATNQAIIAIVPKPNVYYEYLYFSLLYFGKNLVKYNIQSTQKNINKGIDFLRQQILVSAFSIFNNFLCHLVEVLLNKFPKTLKLSENKVKVEDIANLKDYDSIIQFIIKKEIRCFYGLSLKDKKRYLTKKTEFRELNDLWKLDGEELWKDINDKRKMIVHPSELIELSEAQLSLYLYYFYRIMFGMILFAKKITGIDFIPA